MKRIDQQLRMMAVLAHPDDESLGMGGTIARYTTEGAAVHLVTATRGEKGRCDHLTPRPDDEEVGRIREAELLSAASILGVESVTFLGYRDGSLAQADPEEAVDRIAERILHVRPHVVVTFAHDGFYGHPDHIAISQFTTAAVTRAATLGYAVPKLYYIAWPESKWDTYQTALKKIVARVGDQIRQAQPWPEWALTTVLDTRDTWQTVWRAISEHHSQVDGYRRLKDLPQEIHQMLWGSQSYYRALSLVNGGPVLETDLFEGLR